MPILAFEPLPVSAVNARLVWGGRCQNRRQLEIDLVAIGIAEAVELRRRAVANQDIAERFVAQPLQASAIGDRTDVTDVDGDPALQATRIDLAGVSDTAETGLKFTTL
jgi:hypothetical protein